MGTKRLPILINIIAVVMRLVHAQTCGRPPPVPNAILTYSSTSVGATVTYKCRDGFSLSGPSSRTCQSTGKWDNMAPKCFPFCSLPSLPLFAYIKSPSHAKRFATGDRISFGCAKGFEEVGTSEALMCFSGSWVQLRPFKCVANHNCPRQNRRARSSCGLECSPYAGCPAPATHDCLCDGDYCGYSCIEKGLDCGVPPPVANGVRVFSGTQHNATVRYTCNKGYGLQGVVVRRCTGKGKWSRFEPTCATLCDTPETPANSLLIDPKTIYASGEKARFQCAKGFYSKGIITKQCRRGIWIYDPTVTCEPGGCGDHRAPSHGSVYTVSFGVRGTVGFNCKMGYKLSGSKERKCLSSGKWSGVKPSCDPIDCGMPPTPEHGVMFVSDTTFLNVALFLCNDGYLLSGSFDRLCSLNGQWSGTQPKCLAVDCGSLETPENGQIIGNETTFPNNITFICKKNFTLTGSRERVCQVNGTWSGVPTICKRDPIPTPTPIPTPIPISFFISSASGMSEADSSSFSMGAITYFFCVIFLLIVLVSVLILFPPRKKYRCLVHG